MIKTSFMVAAVLGAAATSAAPEQMPAAPEARIAFPNQATIRTFRAVDDDTVYIQHRNRQWYRAELFGPCFNLPFALGIGVFNRGSNVLDRTSELLVEGDRCPIRSFVKSGPPPERKRKRG